MFTALAVQNAKPREKPYVLTDSIGLHLLVKPSGTKVWRLRYRFGGKQNMISLGLYPEVSLATAREKRDQARRLIVEGKDPSQQKKDDKLKAAIAARNTFGAVAREVLDALQEGNAANPPWAKIAGSWKPSRRRSLTALSPRSPRPRSSFS